MSRTDSDRNLLFGILALQNNFIDRHALIAAFDRWTSDKAIPLGAVLVQLDKLDVPKRELLDALVIQHLKLHGDDTEQSLAAISSVDSLRDELRAALADPDVQTSLAGLSKDSLVDTATFAPEGTGTVPPGARAPAGQRYTVLRPHAEGGLGKVSLAVDEELNREVAFKEMQERYADDPAGRLRFLLEAEITGGLQHPSIVPIYGLGAFDDGRPYYAMRFIRGETLQRAIRRFHTSNRADQRAHVGTTLSAAPGTSNETPSQDDPAPSGVSRTAILDTSGSFASREFRELLSRFVAVCNAIEYAHSRGVIHRDLKPANIMLGRFGETLVVDWGLAKPLAAPAPAGADQGCTAAGFDEPLLIPRCGDGSAPTRSGAVIGTPAYMSPEQALGEQEQIGPASDVYALGATLYTLLTGRLPFSNDTNGRLLDRVREGRFPAPRAVCRHVPKQLEAICLKAMCRSVADRYRSSLALADDVERWLADEPVEAYRERPTERAGRWLRRHRAAARAGAISLALVSVVSAGAALVVDAARRGEAAEREVAQRNEQKALAAERAEAQRAEGERTAKQTALSRLAQIEKGTEILGSIFADLDPRAREKEGKELGVLLSERLDRASHELNGEAIGDPLTVARLQTILGRSQRALGHSQQAIELLTQARTVYAESLPPGHSHTLAAMLGLAVSYTDLGMLDLAIPLYEETLDLMNRTLGPEHRDTLSCASGLAVACKADGRFDRALALFKATLTAQEAALGRGHHDTLATMNNLANAYQSAGMRDLAIPLLEEALALTREARGPDHVETLTSMNNLARLYGDAGRFHLAVPLFDETLKLAKARLGPGHPVTLATMNNLAKTQLATAKPDAAFALLNEAVVLANAHLGPNHPGTLACTASLAQAYQALGKPEQALPLIDSVLKRTVDELGADHSNSLTHMNSRAGAYLAAGNVQRAVPLFERALALQRTRLGVDHPDTLSTMNNLAVAYTKAGKLDLALPLAEETLSLRRRKLGTNDPLTLVSMNVLANLYQSAGKLDLALPLFEETLKGRTGTLGPDHPSTLATMKNLANSYLAASKSELALPLFEEMYRMTEVQIGPDDPRTLVSMNDLAAAYWAVKKLEQSIPLFEKALESQTRVLGKEHPDTLMTSANLGVNLRDAGRFDEAISLLEEAYQRRDRHPSLGWTAFELFLAYGTADRKSDAETLASRELANQRSDPALDRVQLSAVLASYGSSFLDFGMYSEAEPVLRECLTIRRERNPDHWTTFNTASMLGGALAGQQEYIAAEPLLLEGYEGLNSHETEIPPQAKARLAEAFERVVELYEATGQNDKSAEFRRRFLGK